MAKEVVILDKEEYQALIDSHSDEEELEYLRACEFTLNTFMRVKDICPSQEAIVPEPPQAPQPNSTFDYAQMTRQQRRAYERRLAKENKRKY